MQFQPLDPLLHSELRLAVMSLLISADEAEFPYIKEQTGATAGNLSVQIDKLSAAGYIEVEKTFKGSLHHLPHHRHGTACVRGIRRGVEVVSDRLQAVKQLVCR